LSKKQLHRLCEQLCQSVFEVKGKSTFKEEFVTAGGIDLKEVNFKRFESKLLPGLFLAGEVLDIDAITGGFNFQAAWTGGWIAGEAMGE
ncbi:MAG: NAD(P)/FAD-dependent oxidoreductase, partial [Lewinella sp.]|nr:NAD(P)/FAD-dependent oxidoreductase [Lewinella sp.]